MAGTKPYSDLGRKIEQRNAEKKRINDSLQGHRLAKLPTLDEDGYINENGLTGWKSGADRRDLSRYMLNRDEFKRHAGGVITRNLANTGRYKTERAEGTGNKGYKGKRK